MRKAKRSGVVEWWSDEQTGEPVSTLQHSNTPTLRRLPSARAAGFSLLELMIVVVLIGVMAALIVPQMRGTYEEALLRSTGRKLADGARLAHSQAITLNAAHRLRIDAASNRYIIERAVRDAERGPGFVPVPHLAGGEGVLDERIAIVVRRPGDLPASNSEPTPVFSRDEAVASGASQSVLFYPDGTADPAEILIRDRDGFGLSLRISPVTARVKLGPTNRE